MAALREKLRDPNLSDTDRRAAWDQMRSLRDQGGRSRGGPRDFGGRRGRGETDIKKVLAMAPADLIKALDKDIDDMMKREKERQAQAAKNGGNAQNGQGNGRGGGPGGGQNQSTARRDQMLSSRPAESRADRTISREMRQAYNEMLQGRASQRGITLSSGGGRGRGG
jgi:hypothetical protein